MTRKAYVKEIKRTKKMKREFEDYFRYLFVILPLGIALIGYAMAKGYFKYNLEITQLIIAIIAISFGLLFAYFTLKRLNQNIAFESIENRKKLELDDLKTEIENNFRIDNIYTNEELGLIEVLTKLTGFSWGERITIIKDGNTFLVNSRPSGIRQPLTIYKDRMNIKKIRNILTK